MALKFLTIILIVFSVVTSQISNLTNVEIKDDNNNCSEDKCKNNLNNLNLTNFNLLDIFDNENSTLNDLFNELNINKTLFKNELISLIISDEFRKSHPPITVDLFKTKNQQKNITDNIQIINKNISKGNQENNNGETPEQKHNFTFQNTTKSHRNLFKSQQSIFYEDDGTPVAWYYLQDLLKNIEPFVQNTTTNCQKDILIYLEHLSNFTLWAVQMYDSSVKVPIGILAGNNLQFGQYDQCISINKAPVEPKYCLAEVQLEPKHNVYPTFHRAPEDYINPFSLEHDMLSSAWEKLILPIDPSRRRRDRFRWAICMPDSCTTEDVRIVLQQGLERLADTAGIMVNVTMPEHACSKKEPSSWTTGEYIMSVILCTSIALMVLTSAYDMLVYQKRENKEAAPDRWTSLTLSFSIYTNMVKLFRPDQTDEMSVMHGMRVYTMFLVMLGHRCLHNYGGPFYNPEFLEERYRKFQDMFLLNGTLITDTFFTLSGFLTCYALVQELSKRRRLNISNVFLYRWMRITPVYMVVVGFYATLLKRLGDGPIWDERVLREVERCQQNWWANLLYINNYVNVQGLCMFQSWYVTCDMHYFIFGTFLVILCHKYKKYLWYIMATVLFASIAIPFVAIFMGRYEGVLRVYMSLLTDPSANDYYNYIYITSHNRAGPYIVGMMSAYVYIHYKKRQTKFSNKIMWVGSALATVFALGSQFFAWPFYIPGREYDVLESSLYGSLHRVIWAIGMGWIIIAGCTTTFGILQPILGLPGLTPLSRLTYSAFLCHGIIQLYTVASVRVPIYMSFPRLFWMLMGDIMMSFILALVLHLLFEAPMNGIQKMLLKPPRKPVVKPKETQQMEMAESVNNNENVINMNENVHEIESSRQPQRY